MLRPFLFTFLCFALALCGCSDWGYESNLAGSVSYSEELQPLVGEWASEGELALLIKRVDDQLIIDNPDNDTWRFEISDSFTEGNSINFVQRHFMRDGSYNPFSEVECQCTIAPVEGDPDSLKYTIVTPQLPKGATDIMKRLD